MNLEHITHENQTKTPVIGASNRASCRSENEGAKNAIPADNPDANGSGSIPFTGIATTLASGTASRSESKNSSLTKTQLEKIKQRLTERDRSVLRAVRKYRFMTSDQIGRLYVTECSTKTSQTRQRNLLLKRLRDYGLLRPLERRVGGYGGGSSIQVWHLTEAGQRLLTENADMTYTRKRIIEPSTMFLKHTLAIAECAVQLVCFCRQSADLSLVEITTEPSCWRSFREDGRLNYLKPDLFAVTTYDNYEDRWFIEMDLGSVSLAQIVEKCKVYLCYYRTGIEQMETEMFPLVVWIVKDDGRKEKIKDALRNNLHGQPKMFLVITPNELERMVRQYIDAKELL